MNTDTRDSHHVFADDVSAFGLSWHIGMCDIYLSLLH